MGIGLDQFQGIVNTAPAADRIIVGHETPDDPKLQNARPGNNLTWLFHVTVEKLSTFFSNRVAQQNQEVLNTFRDALQTEYGPSSGTAALRDEPVQALTANRITGAIQAAQVHAQDRMAALNAIKEENPSDLQIDAALNYVMEDIALPRGARGEAVEPALKGAMRAILPQLIQADGTERLELAGKLGAKLAQRLEEYVVRALYQFDTQSRTGGGRNLDKQPVAPLLAKLEADGGVDALRRMVPAMDVHLNREAAGFTTCMKTLLERLERDHGAIGPRFLETASAGKLVGLTLTDSDPHKQGNRVAILTFEGGGKVVYKPRDVRIDEALSGKDLEARDGPPRRSLLEMAGAQDMTYRFLPRSHEDVDYGYVQFLPHSSAQDHVIDSAEAGRVFGDLGRAIAALMLAGASDLHHENIMVSQGRFFFTDLEFALVPEAIKHLTTLLTLDPPPPKSPEAGPSTPVTAQADTSTEGLATPQQAPKTEDAAKTFEKLMRAMILNDTFSRATDNNPLCSPYNIVDGVFHTAEPTTEVIESLIILRTPDDQGGMTYLHNRVPPQTENGPTPYSLYHSQFGTGVTAGLTALKANGGLAEFHAAIPDFHLRYHPISTQDQRTILGDLRYETFRSTTSAAVADFYNGATELSTLKRLLDGVTLCPPESEKRAPLQAAMYTAYQSHDIPYFSRQVNNRAVYPDGLTSRPLKWGADNTTDYFDSRADAHGADLEARLAQATTLQFAHIGTLASEWMKERVPSEAYVLDLPGNQTRAMIEEITQPRT